MRIFAQSFTREVKKWFRTLPTDSIVYLQQFHQSFLTRWEVKKNPFQILTEYDSLRRAPGERVQYYCTRFNNVYNCILATIQPPPTLALIKFLDGFHEKISY